MDEDDEERVPGAPGEHTGAGGENTAKPEGAGDQPLGPATPDERRPLGDTPEAHDEIIPEDLPKDHPGRHEAERQAAAGDGTAQGNT
ncbi:MAG TPA: hypothetical protein VFG42_23510 [Baekduia sp.]|uniref:hypothetical protein n=1 Tax=Baekduia sp. TaxID=2600305 RepID=UPI002D79AFBE|nr:hypothetical protein [Baekduia sp.]HET6509781.1 hypothetical protein [Baekduia sp.]